MPLSQAKRDVATLTPARWPPRGYCVDIDLTFPNKENADPKGIQGSVSTMGDLQLSVIHTKSLLGGGAGGFGLMASEAKKANAASVSSSPFYVTGAIAKPGSRHKAIFCYDKTANEPSWLVDGKKVTQGYLRNEGAPFAAEQYTTLSLFTGAHDEDIHTLTGATMHSFEITSLPKIGGSTPQAGASGSGGSSTSGSNGSSDRVTPLALAHGGDGSSAQVMPVG